MTRRDPIDSEDWLLADRLVNYADAVVALAFLGVSGLGIAVADPDTRSSVAPAAVYIGAVNVFLGFLWSGLVFVLRRWECELRAALPLSSKYARTSRRLDWARHAVIWVAVGQAVMLMVVIS